MKDPKYIGVMILTFQGH